MGEGMGEYGHVSSVPFPINPGLHLMQDQQTAEMFVESVTQEEYSLYRLNGRFWGCSTTRAAVTACPRSLTTKAVISQWPHAGLPGCHSARATSPGNKCQLPN